MIWPGWGEVLPLLTMLVTAIATVIGAAVTWARFADRTVARAVERAGRQSERAAREAAAGTTSLPLGVVRRSRTGYVRPMVKPKLTVEMEPGLR